MWCSIVIIRNKNKMEKSNEKIIIKLNIETQ